MSRPRSTVHGPPRPPPGRGKPRGRYQRHPGPMLRVNPFQGHQKVSHHADQPASRRSTHQAGTTTEPRPAVKLGATVAMYPDSCHVPPGRDPKRTNPYPYGADGLVGDDESAAELAAERDRCIRARQLATELVALAQEALSPPAEVFIDQFIFDALDAAGLIPEESQPHIRELRPPERDPEKFDAIRHSLPTRGHHVYVLRDRDGGALYIGQTRRPRLRIRDHWANQPWWSEVGEVELQPVTDELEARELEYQLTQELSPQHSQVTNFEVGLLARMRAGER